MAVHQSTSAAVTGLVADVLRVHPWEALFHVKPS